jgi:hypothetical protein
MFLHDIIFLYKDKYEYRIIRNENVTSVLILVTSLLIKVTICLLLVTQNIIF